MRLCCYRVMALLMLVLYVQACGPGPTVDDTGYIVLSWELDNPSPGQGGEVQAVISNVLDTLEFVNVYNASERTIFANFPNGGFPGFAQILQDELRALPYVNFTFKLVFIPRGNSVYNSDDGSVVDAQLEEIANFSWDQ